MAENYGFTANADFTPAYAAAQAALQQRFLKSRRDMEQDLAARGVRTSGVGALPTAELQSGETAANANLIGQFGEKQAEEGITDRRRQEDKAFQEQMLREGYDIQSDLQRTLARRQLQSQLIGAAVGGAGQAASMALMKPPTPRL